MSASDNILALSTAASWQTYPAPRAHGRTQAEEQALTETAAADRDAQSDADGRYCRVVLADREAREPKRVV